MNPTRLRSTVRGVGSCLPQRVIANAEMATIVDTSDEWIVKRTGIRQRYVAAEGETTSTLATHAAEAALADAGLTAGDIDLIVVATSSPDYTFPAVATQVQAALGMTHGVAFDLQAVCSGFVFAVATADKFLVSGSHKRALVIGAETFSRLLDWSDRTTCVLFGDGAGAAILQSRPGSHGLLTAVMGADGAKSNLIHMPGGGSRCPASVDSVAAKLHYLRMDGRETFKSAVQAMYHAAQEALRRCELDISKIKCIIPHQANRRIIDVVGERLGATPEQLFVNLDKYGNTSAASVAIALDEAVTSGKISRGDLILLVVFGSGLTWGAAVIEW